LVKVLFGLVVNPCV